MLRMGVETHIITAALALPLMLDTEGGLIVEMTDGTSEANAGDRPGVGFYYDFVKAGVDRLVRGRRDAWLAAIGAHAGGLRGHRGHLA